MFKISLSGLALAGIATSAAITASLDVSGPVSAGDKWCAGSCLSSDAITGSVFPIRAGVESPAEVSRDGGRWLIVESEPGRVALRASPDDLGYGELRLASPQSDAMHETQRSIGVLIQWPIRIGSGRPGYRHLIGTSEMIEAARARGILNHTGQSLPYPGTSSGLTVYGLGAAPRILSSDASIQCLFYGGELDADGALILVGSLPYILCQIIKADEDYQISFRVPGYLHPRLGEFIANIEVRAAEVVASRRESGE